MGKDSDSSTKAKWVGPEVLNSPALPFQASLEHQCLVTALPRKEQKEPHMFSHSSSKKRWDGLGKAVRSSRAHHRRNHKNSVWHNPCPLLWGICNTRLTKSYLKLISTFCMSPFSVSHNSQFQRLGYHVMTIKANPELSLISILKCVV